MTKHSKISFAKSGIRILGYVALALVTVLGVKPAIILGAVLLLIAELLGIWEEIGAKY